MSPLKLVSAIVFVFCPLSTFMQDMGYLGSIKLFFLSLERFFSDWFFINIQQDYKTLKCEMLWSEIPYLKFYFKDVRKWYVTNIDIQGALALNEKQNRRAWHGVKMFPFKKGDKLFRLSRNALVLVTLKVLKKPCVRMIKMKIRKIATSRMVMLCLVTH